MHLPLDNQFYINEHELRLKQAKAVFFLLTLLLLVVFSVSHSKIAHAQTVLLVENFNDNNANDGSPSDWDETPTSGVWSVNNGKYQGVVNPTTTQQPVSLVGNPSWSDYSMEVSVTGIEGVDRHILFRFTQFHVRGYSIKYREADYGFSGHIELQKHGVNKVLATNSNFKSHIGETHRFRIEAKGNNIKVYADGTLLIDYTDNQDPILDGKVGFQIEPSGIGTPTKTLYDDLIIETNNTQLSLSVPDLKQFTSPWNFDVYDQADRWANGVTIGSWGCALTSASMVLSFHGFPNNPRTLNNWLKSQPDGYIRNGLVNWLAISRYTKINPNAEGKSLEFRRQDANRELIKTNLDNGLPSIIKFNGHFVVVRGRENNEFLVNDPASSENKLSVIQERWGDMLNTNTFVPSQTDLSYIMIISNPEAQLSITDQNDQEVGITFVENPLVDSINNSTSVASPLKVLLLDKPNDGNYFLKVSGEGYKIDSYLYDKNGDVVSSSFNGLISDTDIYQISITENNQIIQKRVTYESILNSLNKANANNFINQKGIYKSISNLIKLSNKLNEEGKIKLAKNVLQLALMQIKLFTPKFIDTDFSENIKADIIFLINQL